MAVDNEYEFLYMYRKSDEQALELLQQKFQPFIIRTYYRIAQNWPSYEFDEAQQAANLGILNAIYYYREDRQMAFHNFVMMCIERQMFSQLRHLKRISKVDYMSCISLDRVLKDNDELYLGDTVGRDDNSDPQRLSHYRLTLEDVYELLGTKTIDRKVLSFRMRGYSYKEIAGFLQVSRKDVDNSVQRIRKKASQLFD